MGIMNSSAGEINLNKNLFLIKKLSKQIFIKRGL